MYGHEGGEVDELLDSSTSATRAAVARTVRASPSRLAGAGGLVWTAVGRDASDGHQTTNVHINHASPNTTTARTTIP